MATTALSIAISYLWGAIPTAYLVGRYLKGIDIRTYGSGNVGASNVSEHVGTRIGLLVGVADSLGKGALPVVMARLLGLEPVVEVSVGVAAIAGHCWSPYLRFTGGRGVATSIGVLIGLWMWKELLVEAVLMGLVGRAIMKQTGFWTFVSILALPLLAVFFDRPNEIVYGAVAIGVTLLLKRLTANWDTPTKDLPTYQVLAYRLVFDRDVSSRKEWTTRRPGQD